MSVHVWGIAERLPLAQLPLIVLLIMPLIVPLIVPPATSSKRSSTALGSCLRPTKLSHLFKF